MRVKKMNVIAGNSEDSHSAVGEISSEESNEARKIGRGETRFLWWMKLAVFCLFIFIAGMAALVVYNSKLNEELSLYNLNFERDSERLASVFLDRKIALTWIAASFSVSFTSLIYIDLASFDTFPEVTLPGFELKAFEGIELNKAASVTFAPLLRNPTQKDLWESYMKGLILVYKGGEHESGWPNRTYMDGIFELNEERIPVSSQVTNETAAPVWQLYPFKNYEKYQFFDMYSEPVRKEAIDRILDQKVFAWSNLLNLETENAFKRDYNESPRALLVAPVLDKPIPGVLNASDFSKKEVIGVIAIEIDFMALFEGVLDEESEPLCAVLENAHGDAFSFLVESSKVKFTGMGDPFREKDDAFRQPVEATDDQSSYPYLQTIEAKGGKIDPPKEFKSLFLHLFGGVELSELEKDTNDYRVKIYPQHEFQSTYTPMIYAIAVILIVLFTAIIFFVYDYVVERRQLMVMNEAVKSRTIVDSLFPSIVRDRVFGTNNENEPENTQVARRRRSFLGGTETIFEGSASMNQYNQDEELAHTSHKFTFRISPKIHLASLLRNQTSSCTTESATTSVSTKHSEPIAEVFPHTTVLFADIEGFTAWSSEREPTQVFELLESVYAGFDEIAKRLKVFKVETIGDCYVAVTGLPESQPDHALRMAQFASECQSNLTNLTKELEVSLGPGTSGLQIRIGMHSGPITAGVLRGDKSRFQVFGDTVNTASRMESHGVATKIQVSEATATLLKEAGFSDWLMPRKDMILAKGKGALKTWWWSDPASNQIERSNAKASGDDWRNLCFDEEFDEEDSACKQCKDGTFSKAQRLIDWNTDVLLGLLEQINSSEQSSSSSRNLVSKADAYQDTGSVFSEIKPDPRVRSQLRRYVSKIASMYRDNDFHNFEHACHVALSASKLMRRITSIDSYQTKSKIAEETFGISSDTLLQFCVVLGALIHDVDHEGVPNTTLIAEESSIAVKYSGQSVAEQHSVDLALELLDAEEFEMVQSMIHGKNKKRKRKFRELMVKIVLATDIMDKERQRLQRERWDRTFSDDCHGRFRCPHTMQREKALTIIEHLIQASDVAHTMQHWHIYIHWNEKLFQEMHHAFMEKRGKNVNPADFWYNGELGFFDNYVIPLARKLKNCRVFGVSSDEYLQYALENRKEWEVKGKEIVATMVKKVSNRTRYQYYNIEGKYKSNDNYEC